MTRILHSSNSGAGHACPWNSPTSPKLAPVGVVIFTVSGRSGSRFPSWFPRMTWMFEPSLFISSKNSGISFHYCMATLVLYLDLLKLTLGGQQY